MDYYVELVYRRFLRELINNVKNFKEIEKSICELCERENWEFIIDEPFDTYWAVKAEDYQKCKEQKLFTVNRGDEICVIVREMRTRIFNIELAKDDSLREKITFLAEFVIVRQVSEIVQDFQAL